MRGAHDNAARAPLLLRCAPHSAHSPRRCASPFGATRMLLPAVTASCRILAGRAGSASKDAHSVPAARASTIPPPLPRAPADRRLLDAARHQHQWHLCQRERRWGPPPSSCLWDTGTRRAAPQRKGPCLAASQLRRGARACLFSAAAAPHIPCNPFVIPSPQNAKVGKGNSHPLGDGDFIALSIVTQPGAPPMPNQPQGVQ